MASSQKKVIVRRFLGDALAGYLPALGFVDQESVSLLDLSGRLSPIQLSEIKFVAFVRDFDLNEARNIDRVLRRSFLTRPRTEGLWVRVTFRTGDTLEGLVAAGISLLDEMLDSHGLQLTPPDTRANCQRVYVPRLAITQLELLAVITAPSKRQVSRRTAKVEGQNELFDLPEPN